MWGEKIRLVLLKKDMKIIQIKESVFKRMATERCYPEQRYPNPDVPDSIGVVIIRGTIATEPSLLHCGELGDKGLCRVSYQHCDGPIPSETEARERIKGDWGKYEMVGKDHRIRLVNLPKAGFELVPKGGLGEKVYRVVEPKKEKVK